MYFSKFPALLYTLDNGKSYQLTTDIFRRSAFINDVIKNVAFYDEYDISDGETPEIVADQAYGNSRYHWIIMMANDIIDPVLDWPMTQNQLVKYSQDKYENIYGVHHYENDDGYETNSGYPVSNLEYEERINETKRRIKIVRREIIPDIIAEFSKIIKQ